MSTNGPMTQEELDSIHMRLGCDNSTTDDVCTLLDEVERLRARLTVDKDMVERAAHGIAAHWRDMHTNESLGRQRMLARAALDAALGTGGDA